MLINKENINTESLPAMLENFALLREKALEYITQSSSGAWTDHNVHDPGITIMEAICYALSDVGFRMNFGFRDLITLKDGSAQTAGYYPPERILPCRSVTISDYRKLLLDLPAVRNAWITPVSPASTDIETDYEPLFADKKRGDLKAGYQVAQLPVSQAEKNEILSEKVLINGLYAVNVRFEPHPFLGNIDSGENYEAVYEKDYFGGIYVHIGNWHRIMGNKPALQAFAEVSHTDPGGIGISISVNPFNRFNDSDDALDDRVLDKWYYDLGITHGNTGLLTFEKVLFEPFFEDRKGISGKDLKKMLRQNNFAFFQNIFGKIQALADAYSGIEATFRENRNLCEDFLSGIGAIPTVELRFCADIDVEPSAELEQVQAEIFHLIDRYISPPVQFYSFEELRRRNVAVEEILEGPLLKSGFVMEEDMGPDYTGQVSLYLSDIVNEIFEIEGLINIRNAQLWFEDEDGRKAGGPGIWEIPVPEGYQPVLSKRKSKIIFYKNDLPLHAGFVGTIDRYHILNTASVKPADSSVPAPASSGVYRDLAVHYTLADEFPSNYRIGKNFPDEYLPDPEMFAGKQLEGYLLMFDQSIANFLADLENLKQTLSWNPVDHIGHNAPAPAWRRDYLVEGQSLDKSVVDRKWQDITEPRTEFLVKRNKALDFLLSRFAENLAGIDHHFYLAIDNAGIDRNTYYEQLIDLKQRYLENYIEISSGRALAINYGESPSYMATTPGGYEQRIARLLGMELQQNQVRKTVSDIRSGNRAERGYFHCLEHIMLRLPRLGDQLEQELILQNLDPVFLSICTDDDCTACGGYDPYSFTASIALPGWLPVYGDIYYRDYMEKLIRKETPVGVMLRICWIDEEKMDAFEKAMEAWWLLRQRFAGSTASDIAANFELFVRAQNELVEILKSFRTVYPPATLHNCEDESREENNTRIFLGRTRLGEEPSDRQDP